MATLRSWLLCWEIYLILLVAAFLRLYQLNTTEFNNDQANLFQMARYAVTYGLIPATSNIASVGIYNPPASIDIFMIPAALTNDPLWGAIMVGILATVSVLLTYGFVRCYYGRVAATIAALMYATLLRAVFSSRTIWNPNLLPLFIVLFLMALFWGVVARRKGWLFPALFLLGTLIQLHPITTMLTIPLVIALVLAPGTMRWRDLVLGLLSLLIIYLPYLLWEIATNFQDFHILMQVLLHPQQKAAFDDMVWLFYQALLNPYDILSKQNPLHWLNVPPYLDETSVLWQLAPHLAWVSQILIYLVIASMATVLALAVWPRGSSSHPLKPARTAWRYVCRYWLELRNSPYRCGLIVLLSWQISPLIILLHHIVQLYLFYFLFLLPGPCILVGIFLAKTAEWLRHVDARSLPANTPLPAPLTDALKRVPTLSRAKALYREPFIHQPQGFSPSERRDPLQRVHGGRVGRWASMGRYGVYALAVLIIVAQFIASTVGILDIDHGNYSDGFKYGFTYNDLRSLQNALTKADQLAQRHHLNRVYLSIASIAHTQDSLRFLSNQMHTPTTIFDSNCVPLPSTEEGPAVVLVGPYSDLTNALLTTKNVNQYSKATLIDKPIRPGGAPFSLYIVSPHPPSAKQVPFSINTGDDLQLDTLPRPLFFNRTPWLVTHWSLLRSAPPSYNKTYTYSITMTHVSNGSQSKSTTNQCSFTAIRAGDQVLIPFNQKNLFTDDHSSAVSVKEHFSEINPLYLHYGPFTFLTFATTAPEHKT